MYLTEPAIKTAITIGKTAVPWKHCQMHEFESPIACSTLAVHTREVVLQPCMHLVLCRSCALRVTPGPQWDAPLPMWESAGQVWLTPPFPTATPNMKFDHMRVREISIGPEGVERVRDTPPPKENVN